MHFATWETITGEENLLVLAERPGDESLFCGGLIARCCRRGRPPFVVVLTDGSASPPPSNAMTADQLANLHDRETRAAVRQLGLPAERLLMAGLLDGTLPAEGPAFNAIVHGLVTIMWARDCNVICAPVPGRLNRAAARFARAVAERSGVGLVFCLTQPDDGADGWYLDITAERAAKHAAIGKHAACPGTTDPLPYERFVRGLAAAACV